MTANPSHRRLRYTELGLCRKKAKQTDPRVCEERDKKTQKYGTRMEQKYSRTHSSASNDFHSAM